MSEGRESMNDELTDEEWREFQAIPDQGFSHRHWVDAKIQERLARPVLSADNREALVARIADQIRSHCTPSVEAYRRGGDFIVEYVADWVENPPDWVTLLPVTPEPTEWEYGAKRTDGRLTEYPNKLEALEMVHMFAGELTLWRRSISTGPGVPVSPTEGDTP